MPRSSRNNRTPTAQAGGASRNVGNNSGGGSITTRTPAGPTANISLSTSRGRPSRAQVRANQHNGSANVTGSLKANSSTNVTNNGRTTNGTSTGNPLVNRSSNVTSSGNTGGSNSSRASTNVSANSNSSNGSNNRNATSQRATTNASNPSSNVTNRASTNVSTNGNSSNGSNSRRTTGQGATTNISNPSSNVTNTTTQSNNSSGNSSDQSRAGRLLGGVTDKLKSIGGSINDATGIKDMVTNEVAARAAGLINQTDDESGATDASYQQQELTNNEQTNDGHINGASFNGIPNYSTGAEAVSNSSTRVFSENGSSEFIELYLDNELVRICKKPNSNRLAVIEGAANRFRSNTNYIFGKAGIVDPRLFVKLVRSCFDSRNASFLKYLEEFY